MSPEKIGRYEIIGQLGKGAMGVVYKATDPTIGRTVALKTMRLDVHSIDAEEMLARFRNEARLAGVLNHSNIVTIFDAGETEGLFYIAMEYIEGETLHQLLAQKRVLPPEQLVELACQVCAGLDAAAAQQVVHRDIKPANIMIQADGSVKIMDFGIAKSGGGMTSMGQVLGTPNYMSPEQVKGKPLDGRSDLFSLGVILYEMVTGEKPFTGDNVTTIIYKIINETPIPPRELDVSIHPGLSAIISKALAKSPEERYQDGAELAHDLSNFKSLASPEDATTRIASGAYQFQSDTNQAVGVQTPPAFAAAQSTVGAAAATSPAREKTRFKLPPRFSSTPAARSFGRRMQENTLPLLAMAAAALLMVIMVVAGILVYVKHTQAQQRAELEKMMAARQEPARPSPAAMNASAKPSPGKAAPKPALEGSPLMTATGELAVSSKPDGAQVQIDGRGEAGWHTPFTAAALLPGPHTVTFTKPGYAGETRIVDLKAGHRISVKARLASVTAMARISSAPPGARILIGGQDSGKVTPAEFTLEKGAHVILLHKSGFRDALTTANLKPGQTFNYAPHLKPEKSAGVSKFRKFFGEPKVAVRIRTTPKGAHVSLNGKAQPKGTPLKLALDPGSYDITLQMDAYKPLHKTVTVQKGKTLELDETLEKQ